MNTQYIVTITTLTFRSIKRKIKLRLLCVYFTFIYSFSDALYTVDLSCDYIIQLIPSPWRASFNIFYFVIATDTSYFFSFLL